MHTIALFGGTFDPIHNGHLYTSLTIQQQFKFDSYRFLPCKIPVIKGKTHATTAQRITMIQLAIAKYPQFALDLRETNRDTPSYMVETLKSIRKEYSDSSITLILGYDAFVHLPQWYHWKEISSLANLLIINRNLFSEHELPEPLKTFKNKHQIKDMNSFLKQRVGALYEFNAGDHPISSTEVRAQIKKQGDLSTQLPKEVYQYIRQMELYQ